MTNREYKLNIDPRILELLGPSLYTNIYYILAELIANAYDADARNVYIIAEKDSITVEDDGAGMSYSGGDITKYLNVAGISRTNENESLTIEMKRRKMGRKGIGKLAALSVSDNVTVKTIQDGEKSGFVLSRQSNVDGRLPALEDDKITFERITDSGTAIVMNNPQYRLNKSLDAVKRNLLKIFPLVDDNFQIHIIRENKEAIINDFNKEMIGELSALKIFGKDFAYLADSFSTPYETHKEKLLSVKSTPITTPIIMKDVEGVEHEYNIEIKGWLGTYKSTRGRKAEVTDFPDNFISLYANKKMGEFNILPKVGGNKLAEVYIVGQLHVDIFELTELPDMALSNRQGYKSDDVRYIEVLKKTRETLLPELIAMREIFVGLRKKKKEEQKLQEQLNNEEKLRQSVNKFRANTSKKAAEKLAKRFAISESETEHIIDDEINANSPELGIKSIVDSQKKKILISQTLGDKDLADIVYAMLIYNNIPKEDILYTNCDDREARPPVDCKLYDYLREFFVESYSTQKMFVLFVTSKNTKSSWGAITEVGAAWITRLQHKIFNIEGFRPEHPLDNERVWHTTTRNNGNLSMTKPNADVFCQFLEYICDQLGYAKNDACKNKTYLSTLISIV